MERGSYRYELDQILEGANGAYRIIKREKRKDETSKAIRRKWYTLLCPKQHKFELEEGHMGRRILRCPSCYHPRIREADPEFAAMFVKEEDTDKYTCMSHVKTDFYCPGCGNICKGKSIHTIYQRRSVPCDACGDGRSYGERIFAAILDALKVEYSSQKRVDWEGARFFYDFELCHRKILVEIHGHQHYGRGFAKMGGRTLEEEQQNDLQKEKIASESGYKLIVVDARDSSLKYIRESIEKNEQLNQVLDLQNLDWNMVSKKASTKRDAEILNLLKEGEDPEKIAAKCRISIKSLPQFKRKFVEDGLWDGISEKEMQKETEKKNIILEIQKLQKKGRKSGDICKELNLNPGTFKRWMGIEVYPDPKKVQKWSAEEAVKVIEREALPVELLSGFKDNRTAASWKCKRCGTQFEATLLGLQKGEKCYQCKGRRKVEEYLTEKFPGEYEIRSAYITSDTEMKFKHLICGQEFERTPHSVKRSVIPCLVCGKRERRIKPEVQ